MSRRRSSINYTAHIYSIQEHTSMRRRKAQQDGTWRAGRRRLIGLALPSGPRGVGRGRADEPPAACRCALASKPRAARAWGARRLLRGPRCSGGRARRFPWLQRLALARKRRDARPRRSGWPMSSSQRWRRVARWRAAVAAGSQRGSRRSGQRGAVMRWELWPRLRRAGLPTPPARLPATRRGTAASGTWLALERTMRYG